MSSSILFKSHMILFCFVVFYTKVFALDCSQPIKLGEQFFNFGTLNKEFIVKNNITTKPTITEFAYKINPCKPLENDKALEKEDQCDSGTFVCQTITNYKKTSRITQVLAFGMNSTNMSIVHEENSAAKLLWKSQGEKNLSEQNSCEITFICNKEIKESDAVPVFSGLSQGRLTFNWSTKEACPLETNPPPSKPDKPETKPPATSGGSVFGYLILSLILFYFFGGMAYNYYVCNQRGIYLIPHFTFWREFPDHFMTLIHRLVSMISGRRRASYNRV